MKVRTLLTFLFIAALSVITFGAQSPRGKQTFPKMGTTTTATKVAVPVPVGFLESQTNLAMLPIRLLPGHTFALSWTGPNGATFQPLWKTNVTQEVWQPFGPMTTNYGVTNPISSAKFTMFKISATTPSPVTSGQIQWLKSGQATAGFQSRARAIITDHANNTIIVGSYSGSISFDGTTLTNAGGSDFFIVKYAPSGVLVWAKRIGGTFDDFGNAVTVDGSDNIIVTGDFSGTVDFGGTTLTYTPPLFGIAPDAFVAKYGPSGGLIWVKKFGGNSGDSGSAVTVDSLGTIYVACSFSSTNADFDGRMLVAQSTDFAVVQMASGGGVNWAIRHGSTDVDQARGIAVDASGNVWVCGQWFNVTDLGNGSVTGHGNADLFIAKYSSLNGSHLFSKTLGSSGTEIATAIAADNLNNIYVTGQYGAALDFGAGQLTPGGIFVTAYSGNGVCRWSKTLNLPQFGFSSDGDSGYGISVVGDNVFITGQVRSTVSFDGNAASQGNGTPNYFAASYTSAAVYRWSSRATAFAIGQASSGGSAAGSFSGTMTISNLSVTGPGFGAAPFAARYQP